MRGMTMQHGRRALALIGGLVACSLAAGASVALANPADQAVAFQGSASHAGFIADAALSAPLTQAWAVTLDGATGYPLIVNGVVYVATNNKTLYALNQATGATLWSRGTGGTSPFAGLAYDGGQVFILNSGGTLTALDPKTGSVNWSRTVPGGDSPPTAAGGIVYVASNGIVRAYRAREGRELWTSSYNGTGFGTPAVDSDSVYVAGACQQDYAFDRASGAQRWHHSTGCSGGGGSTMAVAAGSVYARDFTPGNLILSAASGEVLASFDAGPMPAVAHGRMYALSGSTLTAVSDSGLGTNAWDFTGDGNLVTAPLVVGGVVFVGSSSGQLYALDAATGGSTWSTNVGGAIPAPNEFNLFERTSGLGAANGTLIVPAAGNQLVAYRSDGAITAAPASLAAPTIDGTPRAGDVLGADVGIWSRLPSSYAYRWQRCDGASCADIPGATNPTYKPQAAEVGATLRVRVTATNGAGSSAPVTSGSSAAVLPAPPGILAAPTISGPTHQGATLTADHGSWSGSPTAYAYQWQRCFTPVFGGCDDIAGATGSTFLLTASDVDRQLRVRVVATNSGGDSEPVDSASTATVRSPVPVNQTPPDFYGYLVEGEPLSAVPGTWSDSPTSYAYQWYSCDPAGASCPDIAGATGSVYVLRASDVGRFVGIEVVASNAGGASEPSASDAFGPVALAPPYNLDPPAVAGSFRVGETVTAQPGAWSGRPTRFDYQWYACDAANTACDPIAGATATAYTIAAGDLGRRLGVGVVATNAGGASEEAGSYISPVVAAAAAAPPPPPPAPPATVALPARASFTWAATRVRTDGRIALTVRVATPGAFAAVATTSTSVVYARGSAKAKRAGTVTLVLKPTTTGTRTLRRTRTLRVRVKVTFRASSGAAVATKTRTVSVRARAVRRSQVRVARRPATAGSRSAAPRG